MLVMSKGALSTGQAETYYAEKYTQDDYYTEGQKIVGQWSGEGAATLGLQGDITQEAFKSVLNGRDPRNGQILVPTHKGKHRAGWDATFNAPKSVSLQLLIGGDEALRVAHREAVQIALNELERHVQSRVDRGQHRVTTANMVAAQFEHTAARPSKSGKEQGLGADPHLHTHVVIANLTQRPDGNWRGVEALGLYRSQQFATAVYRSELARKVQALGYEVNITKDWGEWELSGYSREQIEAFSQRRQDITQKLAEQGRSDSLAAQRAAHQTRLKKDGRSESELHQEWQERAQTLGLNLAERTIEAKIREPQPTNADEQKKAAYTAVTYAHEHIIEREAVMQSRSLETEALKRGMGKVVLEETRQEITRQTGKTLVPVELGPLAGNGYTTQEMLRLEKENVEMMKAGQGQAQPLAPAPVVTAWARQRGLYADQTHVVRATLASRNWITAIEGKAGATKTTTVGAMREMLESRGYTVRGFGVTTGSVRALEEAEVESKTVASLVASQIVPQPRQVWIVDESSLLPTKQVNALLNKARSAGVTRVIFVGDQRQHGAIEAGRPLVQMQRAGLETARLDIIRRQRDPELLKAVEFASTGQMKESVNALVTQGRVSEIPEQEERYAAIAKEVSRSVEAGQQVLVVSPANEERRALNTTIRRTLQDGGHLPKDGITHHVLVNRSLTGAARQWAGSYQVGDVVKYRNGSKTRDIAPGEYARVEYVDAAANRLVTRTERGKANLYDPTDLKAVEVYRPEARELVVGERIQFRAPLKEERIPNGAFGKVEKLNPTTGQVKIKLDAGGALTANLKELRKIEYAYAVTSHSSQGASVDRVLVNVDTDQSMTLVNEKQFYVSISRARFDARIFTNKQEDLSRAVSRSWPKAIALEAVPPPTQKVETPHLEQQRARGRGRW